MGENGNKSPGRGSIRHPQWNDGRAGGLANGRQVFGCGSETKELMTAFAGSVLLQQVTDPTTLFDLPGLVRGSAAFALVLVVGAGLLWRYETVIERSIETSIERPLSSLAYGVGAHLTIIFFGVYAASQLGQAAPSSTALANVGLWAGVATLAVAAALGFTVVGAAVIEFRWGRRRWYGLLLGAITAGLAGLADPVFGAIVWVVIVSTGIGGPVRNWFHAAEDVDSVR